jgi:hypothetical protein
LTLHRHAAYVHPQAPHVISSDRLHHAWLLRNLAQLDACTLQYLDTFPFPFYVVLRDIAALPATLADLLRQWFQLHAVQ